MFYSEIDSTIQRGGEEWPRRGLGDRVRDALDLATAMLMLEDDIRVDWELPEDFERKLDRRGAGSARRLVRRDATGRRGRRPGSVPVKPQPCLSPVPAHRRGSTRHTGRVRPQARHW